jgi:hypothetical protein
MELAAGNPGFVAMTILLHFDSPYQFTVLVDGKERARIRKMAESWRLFRTDQKRYSDVDVTTAIRDHRRLRTIIREILAADTV